jgi:CubicO group peptidase (beta-lactamase class C family)/D-alanyl-D-alanine dipeptidase
MILWPRIFVGGLLPFVVHAQFFQPLEALIKREMQEHSLPAVSITLVDKDRVVWSKGFGFSDPQQKVRATSSTVHRIGSVSKLFTDLAVMKLVEQGKLDLDAPVQTYLPSFQPKNPFNKPITLRHLMSHRAGLVREPPVGHYFDASSPSLAATVESLSNTALVYEPGTRTKYSNAGIAVVGYVLERLAKQPFAQYLKQTLIEPLQMQNSAFERESGLKGRVALAEMWAAHRDPFPAPEFELGTSPAGSMYSTTDDLGKFLLAVFEPGRIVKQETLKQMWTPQFAPAGQKDGFGIGFSVSNREGELRIGHGGAIYGFATELAALPESGFGVAVVATKDGANDSTRRIADAALRLLQDSRKPQPPPARFSKLVGEYGWDFNILYVYEQEGKLKTLIEWFFRDTLEETSPGEFRYTTGLYEGERLHFADGGVYVGNVLFPHRPAAKAGATFRVTPMKSTAELRAEASKFAPPQEVGPFFNEDLVDLAPLSPSLKFDIRYASSNNFLGTPFYTEARAFLQRPAALALVKANQSLAPYGYGLLIHDGYRPWSVTRMFYDATPPEQRHFVADPKEGSKHNRGCAVDLTLYDLKTGEVINMPSGYDEMTERAYPGYPGGTSLQRWHRELLRQAMEAQGFTVFKHEWWHFDYKDWPKYPILNVPFEELKR